MNSGLWTRSILIWSLCFSPGDRADAAAQLRCWLDAGHAVVLDRYVYSNVGFQCAKLPAGDRQEELRRWILDLEFGYYGIPRPDVSLFLDVPFALRRKALRGTRRRRPRLPEGGSATSMRHRSTCSVVCGRFTVQPLLRTTACGLSIAAMRGAGWTLPMRFLPASAPR